MIMPKMEVCLKIPKKQFLPEQAESQMKKQIIRLEPPDCCFLTGRNVSVIQLLLKGERNLSGAQEKLEGDSCFPKKELNQGNLVLKKDCHQVFFFNTGKVKQAEFSEFQLLECPWAGVGGGGRTGDGGRGTGILFKRSFQNHLLH